MSESYDISKCDGWIINKKDINGKTILCENRENCLRYTKKADDLLQSWLMPEMKENGNCRNYIYNYKDEQTNKNRKRST